MALPEISAYAMPTPQELPSNRASSAVVVTTEQAPCTLAPVAPAKPSSTIDWLRGELAELLDGSDDVPIESEESLFDRGLDSIRLMTLVERLQRRGAPITFGDLAEQPTLRAWVALIDAHLPLP